MNIDMILDDSLPLGGMKCVGCQVNVLLNNKGVCPLCGFDNSKCFQGNAGSSKICVER